MFIRIQSLRAVAVVLALILPNSVLAAQSDIEAMMWDLVTTTDDISHVEAFIRNYPDSEHIEEARAIADRLRLRQNAHSMEDTIFQSIGSVSYDVPLAFGNEILIGRTLSEIIETSPEYPPIEGLPEAMWKEQTCKSCHTWTRQDLCTQANTYVSMDPAKYREKMHPFGGLLKINLRNWAQNDCE